MPVADRTQYIEAIQNLRQSVSDEELQTGELAVNAFGLPLVWNGNFADVYRVHCPQTGNTWAVKCFARETPGLRERYRQITAHLQDNRLGFTVDFQFVEPGLHVGNQWVPILKMRWVEGLTLNKFVSQYADQPKTLQKLLQLWPILAMRLRQAQLAHGDLQHGNVLLVPVPGTEKLSLKLVDYDGMFVPTLTGHKTGEDGHPNYQHPQRLREGIFSAEIDRFSHLAIYTAIQSLIVGGGKLWAKSDNGENLLFRESDYQNPGESETFRHLWDLEDAQVRALTWRLILAAEDRLEHVPLLEQIVTEGQVQTLTPSQLRHTEQFLFPSRRATPAPSPRTGAKLAQPSPAPHPVPSPQATAKPVEPPLGAKPKSSKPAETFQVSVNSLGMKFVLLPPGEFLMGSPDSDGDADSDEKPQHRVRITKPFYLGVYEVTQAQYQKVVGSNPISFGGESLPVATILWEDAVAFCKRLSEVPAERAAGRTYRLPREAEWEYACRAGSTSKYSFGDSEAELGKHAWYDESSGETYPVGEKQANAWGLYDMHGNVWEWCQDWYGPYAAGPASDPSGPDSASDRVIRGGSCDLTSAYCRSASRDRYSPSLRYHGLGFRVAAVQSPR